MPTDFFQTCDEEYLEVSFSVDAKHFLSDAHRAFTAGLKKGRKEVNVKKLTPEERERIDAGKAKEISQWLKYKVVRAVPRSAAQGRVLMQMRWVLSFKADGTGKGRIVVRGYQHENLGGLRTEAPTASKRCKHLFLLKCAQQRWVVQKGDVRCAFLQGDVGNNAQADRVFCEPLPELAAAMGLTKDQVVELIRSVYGLVDGGRG